MTIYKLMKATGSETSQKDTTHVQWPLSRHTWPLSRHTWPQKDTRTVAAFSYVQLWAFCASFLEDSDSMAHAHAHVMSSTFPSSCTCMRLCVWVHASFSVPDSAYARMYLALRLQGCTCHLCVCVCVCACHTFIFANPGSTT